MLMGGAFHLDKQIKGDVHQRYSHCYEIAQCEWTFKAHSHGALQLWLRDCMGFCAIVAMSIESYTTH